MKIHFQTYQWSYFVVTILNVKLSNNAPIIRASCRAWQCVFHLQSMVTAWLNHAIRSHFLITACLNCQWQRHERALKSVRIWSIMLYSIALQPAAGQVVLFGTPPHLLITYLFITQSVLRQTHSLLQIEFSTEYDLGLPLWVKLCIYYKNYICAIKLHNDLGC